MDTAFAPECPLWGHPDKKKIRMMEQEMSQSPANARPPREVEGGLKFLSDGRLFPFAFACIDCLATGIVASLHWVLFFIQCSETEYVCKMELMQSLEHTRTSLHFHCREMWSIECKIRPI